MTTATSIPNEASLCGAGGFSSGVCCSTPDWPSSGTCHCGAFRCWQRDATSCECVIGTAALSDDKFTQTTCSAAPKTKCCQGRVGPQSINSGAVCGCGFIACPSGATEVQQCTPSGSVCAGNTASTAVPVCK